MIDESLLWKQFLNRADGSLAERPNLELSAVGPRESGGAKTALPVHGIGAEFGAAVTPVILNP